MSHLRTVAVTLLALCPLAVVLGQDWKRNPFPNWNDDTVFRLITNSPWVRAKSVNLKWHKRSDQPVTPTEIPGTGPTANRQFGSPVGGVGVPKADLPLEADILIRWASALPVRQAEALYRLRDEKLPPSKLNELVGVQSQDYILEIFGVPAPVAHKGTGSLELLASQSVYLRTGSGRIIKPNRVEAKLTALTVTIFVHFPRTDPITLKDEEIECLGDLQVFGFKEKFKLSAMTYLGHLEL